MIQVKVSSKEFQTYISAILNVDRSGVSLKIFPTYIEALVLSEDNSSIILYTKLNILDISGMEKDEEIIHIKDLTKFQRLLDMNEDETFTFTINGNHVYYENSTVKGAKFMLADRASRVVNDRVNVEWFNRFEKTSKMSIDKATVKKIIQCSSFTSDDANKVYVYQDIEKRYREVNDDETATHVYDEELKKFRLPIKKEVVIDDEVVIEEEEPTHVEYVVDVAIAEINDRTKNNLDMMSIYIGDIESGKMEGKVILNVSTLSRLFLADKMTLETSSIGKGVSQTEIVFLSFTNENVSVRYLLNTLRS
jgi:hypothetical protein